MYIRKKVGKISTSVQLVEGKRVGKQVKQTVLKYIGCKKNEDNSGIKELMEMAEYIKYELETKGQTTLLPLEYENVTIKEEEKNDKIYNVNIHKLKEEGRIIKGISDIYGTVYDQIGFNSIFGTKQKTKNYAQILKQITLARIASPKSKRASVEMLDKDYGIKLNLDHVYNMMKGITDEKIDEIQDISFNYTKNILNEKINVLFMDGTTLYFESQVEDGFREKGYSKDGKFSETQVALTILVTESGLPIGYKLYNGSHYEGNSLKDLIEEIEKKYEINKIVLVADSGFLNQENTDYLDNRGNKYILGTRIKNTTKAIQEQIIDKSKYTITEENSKGEMIRGYKEIEYKEKRLIVNYSKKRADKDKKDRMKNIKKLLKKQGKDIKELVSNFGYKKFLKQVGEAKVEIDEEKLKQAEAWDGLHGIITNDKEITSIEARSYYRGLRQVEESFRLNKHDLLIRPIFHWTEQKIKAHVAIAFMAFSLVRHLENRMRLSGNKVSPEVIRETLLRIQGSIIYEEGKSKKFFLPSKISNIGKDIYRVMNKKWLNCVQEIK